MNGLADQWTARGRAAERKRAWQHRRAELLLEACKQVAEKIANGQSLGKTLKEVARKFRNRSLGNGRQLALSAKSAERIWYQFIERGEAAFALKYVAGRKQDIDPLLLRLIVQGSVQQSKTVREILTEAGLSGRAGRISLSTIYRALPSKEIGRFVRGERRLLARRKATERTLLAITDELRQLREGAARKFLTKDDG